MKNYSVNVSLNGVHYFETQNRSIESAEKLKTLLNDFSVRFPKSEGFELIITEHETVDRILRISE